jgi:hypothetical protein
MQSLAYQLLQPGPEYFGGGGQPLRQLPSVVKAAARQLHRSFPPVFKHAPRAVPRLVVQQLTQASVLVVGQALPPPSCWPINEVARNATHTSARPTRKIILFIKQYPPEEIFVAEFCT